MLSAVETNSILSYKACINIVRNAMVETSKKNIHMPLRKGMSLNENGKVLGYMFGYLGKPKCFGVKLVSLFENNNKKGYSSHLGLMVLYEINNGLPIAIMDGSVITSIRTAAASAVATEQLARKNASILSILGTGEQAKSHLYSIPCVRSLSKIIIWGRNPKKVQAFINKHKNNTSINLQSSNNIESAVKHADIICTVTSSSEPILFNKWIKPGTHLNLVGSSVPNKSEVDNDLVLKSKFYVDYRESTLAQAGEFLKAKNEGLLNNSHIKGEIGEVILGKKESRTSETEVTVYKSLGVASQDLAAAYYVYQNAKKNNIGQIINI